MFKKIFTAALVALSLGTAFTATTAPASACDYGYCSHYHSYHSYGYSHSYGYGGY